MTNLRHGEVQQRRHRNWLQPLINSSLLVMTLVTPHAVLATCQPENSLWEGYKARFMQDDGRIIDLNDTGKSTSEGQAYALFHALVANDQGSFDKILRWTRDNLGGGDLTNRLPAWKWGKDKDGHWGTLDENSASDADIWLAYSLLEGGRLWQRPELSKLGHSLLQRIRKEEVVPMKGLGPMLLPGKTGFALSQCQWTLNPSYLPIQVLRLFAHVDTSGPWQDMATATRQLILGSSPKGIVPDWIVYDEEQGFISDPDHGRKGSYDAIRTYLWAGMLADDEPLKKPLVKGLSFDCQGKCWPPQFSNTLTGERYGQGSPGLGAATIPWLAAKQNALCQKTQVARASNTTSANYYDENLKLFALNWQTGNLRFNKTGQLQPRWKETCQ